MYTQNTILPPMDSNPSCRQMVAQPATFRSAQPAPHPTMPEIPAEIQRYIPGIAVVLGNEIAKVLSTQPNHPAFVYYFNRIAMERYSGELWAQSVRFGAMLLWKNLNERRGVAIENLVQEVSYATMALKAAVTALMDPVVVQHCSAALQNELRYLADKHASYQQQFHQMLANYQRGLSIMTNPQVAAQHYGGIVGAALTSGMQTAHPSGDFNQYGAQLSQTVSSGGIPAGVNEVDFRKVMMRKPTDNPSQKRSYMFSMDQGIEQTQKEPEKPSIPPVVFQEPKADLDFTQAPQVQPIDTKESKPTIEDWTAFEGQFFLPAFNANYTKLDFEWHDTKWGRKVLAFIVPLSEEEMQEKEHQIPDFVKQERREYFEKHGETKLDTILRDMDLLAKGIRLKGKGETPEQTEKFLKMGLTPAFFGIKEDHTNEEQESTQENMQDNQEIIHASGELDFVSRCRMNSLVDKESFPKTTKGDVLASTLVTKKCMDYFFEIFTDSTSLLSGLRNLQKYTKENKNDQEAKTAFTYINRFISGEIEFVLKNRMGLTGVKFTDAINDIEPMVNALKDNFGIAYAKAWQEFEPELFECIKDSLKYFQEITDEEGLVMGYAQQFTRSSVLVLLDSDNEEFGVQITGNSPHELFESNYPGLGQSVCSFIKQFPQSMRFYIAVKDKVYSVHRSIVGDKPAVIFDEEIYA